MSDYVSMLPRSDRRDGMRVQKPVTHFSENRFDRHFYKMLNHARSHKSYLQQEYKSQRRLFWPALSFVTIVILVMVSLAIVAAKSFYNNQHATDAFLDEGDFEAYLQTQTDLLEGVNCVNCSIFSSIFDGEGFNSMVRRNENGKCCLSETAPIISGVLKKLGKINSQTRERVNAIEDAIRAVTLSYKDKLPSTESLALTLRFSEGGLNNDRSSIHLRGTFSPSNGKMFWSNRAAITNIFLTPDSSSVKIGSSGYFFIYATVKFSRAPQFNREVSFYIYQTTTLGYSILDHARCTKTTFTSGKTFICSVNVVVKLRGGDVLFIGFGSHMSNYVSSEQSVHTFGMFESGLLSF